MKARSVAPESIPFIGCRPSHRRVGIAVLVGLVLVPAIFGQTSTSLIVSSPAGVAVLDVSSNAPTPLAMPFDALASNWIAGPSTLLKWDPERQIWALHTWVEDTWRDDKGNALPLPLAGEALVPWEFDTHLSGTESRRVILMGQSPTLEDRFTLLSPGLNLFGDPFNLYKFPLAAEWEELVQDVSATRATPPPPEGFFGGRMGGVSIAPVTVDVATNQVRYRIERGAFTREPLGVFSQVLFPGQALAPGAGWRWEGLAPPGEHPLEWTDTLLEVPLLSHLKLWVVAPLTDADGDGLADAVEHLVVGSIPLSGSEVEADGLGATPDSAQTLAVRRSASTELNALVASAARKPGSSTPWVELNGQQEASVSQHRAKASALKQAGLRHEKDMVYLPVAESP